MREDLSIWPRNAEQKIEGLASLPSMKFRALSMSSASTSGDIPSSQAISIQGMYKIEGQSEVNQIKSTMHTRVHAHVL